MVAEDEPMVISAAISSLGAINPENVEEVVDAIQYVNKRNSVLNPTSSLAWQVCDTFEKLAPSASRRAITVMTGTLTEIAANYRYSTPVRDKAKSLLKTLANSNSSKNSDAK